MAATLDLQRQSSTIDVIHQKFWCSYLNVTKSKQRASNSISMWFGFGSLSFSLNPVFALSLGSIWIHFRSVSFCFVLSSSSLHHLPFVAKSHLNHSNLESKLSECAFLNHLANDLFAFNFWIPKMSAAQKQRLAFASLRSSMASESGALSEFCCFSRSNKVRSYWCRFHPFSIFCCCWLNQRRSAW